MSSDLHGHKGSTPIPGFEDAVLDHRTVAEEGDETVHVLPEPGIRLQTPEIVYDEPAAGGIVPILRSLLAELRGEALPTHAPSIKVVLTILICVFACARDSTGSAIPRVA